MPYHPDPWQELLAGLPSWRSVLLLRTAFLRTRLARCGSNVVLAQGVLLRYPERITIGSTVFVNRGTTITARAPITIGNDVLIGPNVIVDSGNHNYTDLTKPIHAQGYSRAPIAIESDVWIGASAVILPGVTLGHGCVIAAGAVVTRDVSPLTIVGGVPAHLLRHRVDNPSECA